MTKNLDYYKVLGVDKNASGDEIKKSYRKLAREHHPDMVQDSDKEAAEKRFKEINEAYQVLGDPEKKKLYDQFGHAGVNGNGTGGQGNPGGPFSYSYTSNGQGFDFGNIDPFDVFEEFFGFRGFGGSRKPRKGKNLYYELMVSFQDAVFGIEKEVNVESGKVKVKIPAGVIDGNELRFEGKGMPGPEGTPPGDLFLRLKVSMPKEFKLAGSTLYVLLELDWVYSALGLEAEIPVVDLNEKSGIGRTKLKIPAGTEYGTKFSVRSRGLPRVHGSGQGDIIVQVVFTPSKRLNKNQKKALEDYIKY